MAIANQMRTKRLSLMYACAGWLIAIGFILCFTGMLYSMPEVTDALDPMLETTQDVWLLFMGRYSFAISVGGLALMFIGAGVVWFAEFGKLPTKNRIIGRWQWRVRE